MRKLLCRRSVWSSGRTCPTTEQTDPDGPAEPTSGAHLANLPYPDSLGSGNTSPAANRDSTQTGSASTVTVSAFRTNARRPGELCQEISGAPSLEHVDVQGLVATNFLSRAFSASSSLSRLVSLAFMPPYWATGCTDSCAGASTPRSPSCSPWPPPSTPGGPRSTRSSRPASPTHAPRATTDWSNRSNESAADSGTRRTLPAGYDSTAPANSGPQPRLHADCPVKIEEPL